MAEASILRDALVYLGAAVVCVPLAKRAGLGSVLGYLIAGCLIGPWGLGFVTNVQSILHFAEFGVVLMLFLIGLELDLKRLVGMRGPVFGGGALQMGACGALLGIGLWAAGLPWQGAIVAGLALAMSSTAIAVQTMAERNLLNAPVGRSAFAVLLFQDIAAIPLIALVPLLGSADAGGEPGWQLAAKGLAAIVVVIVIGRFLTRPLMRLIAAADVREIFTAFALLLVFGIAELMTMAGLSMALGAFLAGVLLASSEYRHALETDIAPFKGLLLGLFFIAVGMSIDFGLVGAEPLKLALLVAGLLLAKAVALAVIAHRGRGAVDGRHAAHAAGARCAAGAPCTGAARGRHHRRRFGAGDRRRRRALRPDHRAPAVRARCARHRPRSRSGPDRPAAPLRLQGVLR